MSEDQERDLSMSDRIRIASGRFKLPDPSEAETRATSRNETIADPSEAARATSSNTMLPDPDDLDDEEGE